ncbi:ATP-binding protein [Pelomonas sp. CA6]|uniref:AAA family ATPase n=1 Tax=Pelomonas sp. CA6 TaxID=2907999 RepID=UPI001F4A8634|nr:ATP-binding protein [Pelomonas sp. CA6]MCH7342690.1 ATP-binding protein [Pelomonas sp. CA6]
MLADLRSDAPSAARPADTAPADASGLARSLQRLDRVLEAAIAEFESAFDRDPAGAAFRGLVVPGADAARLLALPPGGHAWSVPAGTADQARFLPAGEPSRLARLQQLFGLDAFDTDALLVAASPDLDTRYERLFGLLQDDVTRRRPMLATLARLAAPRPEPQWQGLARLLGAQSRLQRHGLARVAADPAQPLAALGAHTLVVDPLVLGFLCGHDALDAGLQPFCELRQPLPWAGFEGSWQRHPELERLLQHPGLHTLRLHGATRWERLHLGHALASWLGARLLCLRPPPAAQAQTLARAQLAARLLGAVLLVEDDGGASLADAPPDGGPRLLSSATADEGVGVPALEVRLPTPDERHARWRDRLRAAGRRASAHDLAEVAREFPLDDEQTDAAAAAACAAAGDEALPRQALFAAARRALSVRLPRALQAITPRAGWQHLILAPDAEHQLREICVHVRERAKVFDDWGFGAASARGQGVIALFSGVSGTGKSTACEVLAGELGRSLLKIDLSQTVSKYIGESEKHLAEVFEVAEQSGALLMLDEADALFGKRTGVSDAHDRYANIEVSYLLQRIEAFRGILVLTTNLQANIDPAFLRRLQFVVEFAFPDPAQRERIWRISVPAQAPCDADLDFPALAQRYVVAGGHIRNIALSAAMLAAGRGERIAMRHIAHGALREYQKLGKALPDGDYFSSGAPR